VLMGAVALVVVLGVALAGGDLRRLAAVRLRSAVLLPLALALQVLVVNVVPGAPRAFTVGVHLGTYLMAAAFVWRNRSLSGLPVLAAGAAANGITIALNGGTLPASAAALRFAGLQEDPTVFTNSGPLAHPRLPWLGDVFAVPAGFPLANVFSVGDVLILVGIALVLHRVCRAPQPAPLTADVDPLLSQPQATLVAELEAALAALRETGRRNDALACELALLRQAALADVRDLPEQRGAPVRTSA